MNLAETQLKLPPGSPLGWVCRAAYPKDGHHLRYVFVRNKVAYASDRRRIHYTPVNMIDGAYALDAEGTCSSVRVPITANKRYVDEIIKRVVEVTDAPLVHVPHDQVQYYMQQHKHLAHFDFGETIKIKDEFLFDAVVTHADTFLMRSDDTRCVYGCGLQGTFIIKSTRVRRDHV